MEEITLTRRELYDLVWSQPMLTLSKKYSISDVGLRKICVRMNIPLPKAGHWQKLQFKKRAAIKALPKDFVGNGKINLQIRIEGEEKKPGIRSQLSVLQKEIENDSRLILPVPEKLVNPDKLVVAAKESLDKKLNSTSFHGVINCETNVLDIRVAPENVKRCLRFMDTLIKLLKKRGHGILIKNSHTYAVVEEGNIEICFREKLKKVIVHNSYSNSTEYHPNGILSFRINGFYGTEWKDGKELLEMQLTKIIAKLEMQGRAEKEQRIKLEILQAERIAKERIAKEHEQRKQDELDDFNALLYESKRWNVTNQLRNYIDAVEQKAILKETMTDQLIHWIKWARKKADWFDPLIEIEDELLSSEYRGNPTFKKSFL